MKDRQYLATVALHACLVANAPKDTWNLALNGIRILSDENGWYVAIGGEIAPYASITNAKWKKGKNPNEGWIQMAIDETVPHIKQIMSGQMSQEELDNIIQKDFYSKIAMQRREHISKKERDYANI